MTKQIFTKWAKIEPLIGGNNKYSSYVTFKLCVKKLKNSFVDLPLSDSDFHKKQNSGIIDSDIQIIIMNYRLTPGSRFVKGVNKTISQFFGGGGGNRTHVRKNFGIHFYKLSL